MFTKAKDEDTVTRSTTLAVLAIAAFALTGCTQHSTGTPTTTTSAGSPSGSPTGGKSLADPCTLLTSSDIAQLGLPDAGKKEDLGGQRGCVWIVSGRDGYSLSVGIRDTQGIKDIQSQGSRTSDAPVGKHQARLVEAPTGNTGGCLLVLGVTSSSRVDVQVAANTSAQACQVATQVAAKVEPHLPS